MVKAWGTVWWAEYTKGVNITISYLPPVLEVNAKLICRICFSQKLVFINSKGGVEIAQVWDGRFTHAHGADLLGFHQRDVEKGAQLLRERGRFVAPPNRGAASAALPLLGSPANGRKVTVTGHSRSRNAVSSAAHGRLVGIAGGVALRY